MADKLVTSGPQGQNTEEDRKRRMKLATVGTVRKRALSMVDEGYSDDEIDEYLATQGLTAKDLRTYANKKKKADRSDAPGPLASGVVAWADQGIPFFDEALAGTVAGGKKLTGDKRKLGDIYKSEKEFVDTQLNRFAENEGATTLGRIGGALHQGLITGRAAVPKGSSVKRALAGITAEGAGTAAVEAADQAEGGLLERGKAALKAAPIGAGLGLTLGGATMAAPGLLRGVLRGGKKAGKRMRDTIDDYALAEAGVPTMGQAGGPKSVVRSFEGGTANLPFIQIPLLDKYRGQNELMRGAITRRRQGMGAGADITSPALAGQQLEKGVDSWIKRAQLEQRNLYADVGNKVGWNTNTPIHNTLQTLDAMQNRIPDIPSISNIFSNAKLGQMLKALIKQQTHSFRGVKQLRSEIGAMLENPRLIEDIPRGELKRLYAALTKDMGEAVASKGSRAMQSWHTANQFTKQLHDRVEDFLQPMMGKRTGEDMYKFATHDGTTLRQVMRSTNLPEERKAVAATMLHKIAQPPPGIQDETGEMFSPAHFLTNWNKLDDEAKKIVREQMNPQERMRFDAALRVAHNRKEAASAMSNPSGTSPNISFQAIFAGLLWSLYGITKLVGGAAGGMMATKALTNPKAVKWLAKETKSNKLTRAAAIGMPGLTSAVQGIFGE